MDELKGKRLLFAHNWNDNSFAAQSKYLATVLSKDNKVIFINAARRGIAYEKLNDNLEVMDWPGTKRPTGIKSFWWLFCLVRKFRPDVTVSQFVAVNFVLIVSYLLGVKRRVCYYHTLTAQNELDVKQSRITKLFTHVRKKFIYKLATHIIAVSDAAKQDLQKTFDINPKSVRVLFNAVYPAPKKNRSTGEAIFCFLGRLDFSKGVDLLIESTLLIVKKGYPIRTVIAGDGIEQDRLKAMVASKNLQDKVSFLNKIPYSEVINLITESYCLVLPSRSDNLPTVILEAFSTCTPVIAARVGGVSEIVIDEYNGYLFESENVVQLAGCMEKLILNKPIHQQLSANAGQYFQEHFSMENYEKRFIKALD